MKNEIETQSQSVIGHKNCVALILRLLLIEYAFSLFLPFGDDDHVGEDKEVELFSLDLMAAEELLLHLQSHHCPFLLQLTTCRHQRERLQCARVCVCE